MTFATSTHAAPGGRPRRVTARAGHADPAITLRVYAHVTNEQLMEAAGIFAAAVGESVA